MYRIVLWTLLKTKSISNAHEDKTKEIEKWIKITKKTFYKWHTKYSILKKSLKYVYTQIHLSIQWMMMMIYVLDIQLIRMSNVMYIEKKFFS